MKRILPSTGTFPVVVVGAGITGCTIAERLASGCDVPVLVLESRAAAARQ